MTIYTRVFVYRDPHSGGWVREIREFHARDNQGRVLWSSTYGTRAAAQGKNL